MTDQPNPLPVGVAVDVPPPHLRFQIRGLNELLDLPTGEQLIEGLIPRPGLVVIYGQPKTMKSFIAMGMALSVAVGCGWYDKAALRGRVLYVIGEGVAGTPPRVRAWFEDRPPDDWKAAADNFHWLGEPVQLLENAQLSDLIAAIEKLPEPPVLIVFDTLARCFYGGDENEAKDMSRFVAAAEDLKRRFNATVMIVHHCGKDGKSMRGSSALNGAADTVLRVERDGDRITLKIEAQKDLGELDPIYFEKHVVRLGLDANGRQMVSCRLALADAPPDEKAGRDRLPTVKDRVLGVLEQSQQGEYFKVRQLAKKVGASVSAVQYAVADLAENGLAKRRPGEVRYCGDDPEGWEDPPAARGSKASRGSSTLPAAEDPAATEPGVGQNEHAEPERSGA